MLQSDDVSTLRRGLVTVPSVVRADTPTASTAHVHLCTVYEPGGSADSAPEPDQDVLHSTYNTGPVHSAPCMDDYQSSYLIRIPSQRMIRWCEGEPLTPSGPIWIRPGSVAGWQGFHQVLVVPLQPRARVGATGGSEQRSGSEVEGAAIPYSTGIPFWPILGK
jgi:hypothetical protein